MKRHALERSCFLPSLFLVLFVTGCAAESVRPASTLEPTAAQGTAIQNLEDILVSTETASNCTDIVSISSTTGVQQKVTTDSRCEATPRWAPNHDQIAYVRGDGSTFSGSIVTLDVQSRREQVLTRVESADREPDWSPDGKRIVFSRGFRTPRGLNSGIFVMDADGSHVERLTHSPGPDEDPQWSPRGDRIMFVSCRGCDVGTDLFTIRPDGTNIERITRDLYYDENPAWSPSGRDIAWVRRQDEDSAQVVVLNLRTNKRRRLTNSALYNSDPDWSSDGQSLVFTRGGPFEVYVMDATGENQHKLSVTEGDYFSPDW